MSVLQYWKAFDERSEALLRRHPLAGFLLVYGYAVLLSWAIAVTFKDSETPDYVLALAVTIGVVLGVRINKDSAARTDKVAWFSAAVSFASMVLIGLAAVLWLAG